MIKIDKEFKLSLFANGILYKEITTILPKSSTNNNQFSNVTGYRINSHKSIVFLYSINRLTEKEIMDTFPFTIASRKIKYSGIGLTKEVKEHYNKN